MVAPTGARSVYLVYADYSLIGVVASEAQAKAAFPNQAITLVGPVKLNQPIEWDLVDEQRIKTDDYKSSDYVGMADGVPAPDVEGNSGLYRKVLGYSG